MEIKRFFVNKNDICNDFVTIIGEEFYHLATVLRHKVGYKIIVCCDDGFDYYATITEITKDKAVAKIEEKVVNKAKTKTDISLFQAVIKSAKLDIVVQKAVELGVKEIFLFYSHNTNETNINIDRLNKISKEASKQCGRADYVKIGEVLSFDEMLNKVAEYDNIVMPYEYEDKTNFSDQKFNKGDYALIIGSEGGFIPEEEEKVGKLGGESVSLGNRILRAETASIVAISLLMYSLGEFNK